MALGHHVERLVVGEDEVGVAAHPQVAAIHADIGEAVHLVDEHPGVDHHPVADHRNHMGIENTAGNKLELEGLALHHQGVTGVVAALIAHHHVHVTGQKVGELALALVTPLRPDDHRCWQRPTPKVRLTGRPYSRPAAPRTCFLTGSGVIPPCGTG